MCVDFLKRYYVCQDTGLLCCELYQYLNIREDGMVFNSNPKSTSKHKGWNKGTKNGRGYMFTAIPNTNGELIRIHRAVAISFIHNDNEKENIVDHINGNIDDNRVSNLRWSTNINNVRNNKRSRIGRTPGVTYHTKRNVWYVRIYSDGKTKHLGEFKSEEDAKKKLCEYNNRNNQMFCGKKVAVKI